MQQKLLPVAVLPHTTLYAQASDPSVRSPAGEDVVATIEPRYFREAVKAYWNAELVWRARNGLRQRWPRLSASHRLSDGQATLFTFLVLGFAAACLLLSPQFIGNVLTAVFSLIFMGTIQLRLMGILNLGFPARHARPLPDVELPVFSVLVPVFKEVGILKQLLFALEHIDYPRDKLDIKLILEGTDTPMQRAVARINLPVHFEVLVVPPGNPQTKPRALNYALQFASGTLLTIFDAEDVPEPQQLRLAAAAFAELAPDVACLQAELTFYNANENWLTRHFTMEYATLFRLVLPALAKTNLPYPLGGTSNHFRIRALRHAGGWDPFNVTEDADLGFRLARLGYQSSVLSSATYEEANTELGNWLQQRTRWLKGFLQTWLVHMRNPIKAMRELGFAGFWVLQAATLGVFLSALLHPFFLALTAHQITVGAFAQGGIHTGQIVLNSLYLGLMMLGAGVAFYSAYLALRAKQISGWWPTLATLPVYWLLMCAAAWLALWQFIWRPFHWNKTRHGLTRFFLK